MIMKSNSNESVEIKENKLTINNHHVDPRGNKHRNRFYAKQFDAGIFVSINNGKTRLGEDRNCYIFLSNEQIAELKKFLK